MSKVAFSFRVDLRILERRIGNAIDHRGVEGDELRLGDVGREGCPVEDLSADVEAHLVQRLVDRLLPLGAEDPLGRFSTSITAIACIVPHCQSVAGSKSVLASTSSLSRASPLA